MAKSSNKQFAKTIKDAMVASDFVPMSDLEYSALAALVAAYGAKRICDNAREMEATQNDNG